MTFYERIDLLVRFEIFPYHVILVGYFLLCDVKHIFVYTLEISSEKGSKTVVLLRFITGRPFDFGTEFSVTLDLLCER